jgi:hypothetical protein
MNTEPAAAAITERPKRSLAVEQVGSPSLSRHPLDGTRLAAPYPLGAHARRVLRAVILAICPPAPPPRSEALLDRVEIGARRLLRYMHPAVARLLVMGMVVADFVPILWLSRRLHRMTPGRASAVLTSWARSRLLVLRLFVTGLRGMVLSVYFDQDEVHRAMGYAPVPFLRRKMELRQRLTTPVPLAAE